MANGNQTKVGRDSIKALLLDRHWWPVDWVVDQLKDGIPPERACRVFRSYRSTPHKYTEEIQIEEGAVIAIRNLVGSAIGGNIVEARGPRCGPRDIRLLEWYCGSCGLRMQGWDERPDHGFCAECAEHILPKE